MDLLDLQNISSALQARHLASPLRLACSASPQDSADSVAEELRANQFDVAPVVDAGRPVGLFRADTADGELVRDCLRPLDAGVLVSGDTSISELIEHLCDEPFVFVVQGREVRGFVTAADLGAAPARTHFYLLLSSLEISLYRYLRGQYPDQALAVSHLSARRREGHTRLCAQLRERDQFLDDLSAMSLMDLVGVAGKTFTFKEVAIEMSGQGWGRLTRGLANFRDDVMHPAREDFARIATGTKGTTRLVEIERRLHVLIRTAQTLTPSG